MAIQFAAKMGFKTISIARGKDKEEMARKLGAIHYIDSQSNNAAEELAKMGGAKVILRTVSSAKAYCSLVFPKHVVFSLSFCQLSLCAFYSIKAPGTCKLI